jgi:hypothetical protein
MNAAEQAKSLETTSKIAAIVNLFKTEFPDARVDLKPWCNDPHTRTLLDPESIDIGFHLPGWSPRYQCRSILVQTRLHTDEDLQIQRLIGLELLGFSYDGEEWRLSTVGAWTFLGRKLPVPDIQERFKRFCEKIFMLFQV